MKLKDVMEIMKKAECERSFRKAMMLYGIHC